MPTELELIALETEFDLLLPFIKRLVLSLPDCHDRILAAMWVQSLRKVKDENFKKLRNEHAKLLLFALHRRSLVGVFEKPPPDEIESFHNGLTLMEMTRELIEITERKKTEANNEDPTKRPLPIVVTSISADLKQYAAVQQIPKFGAHCFMAVSNEPIQMWHKVPNVKYPQIGELPNLQLWEEAFANVDDHVLERQAAIDKANALAKAMESGSINEDELKPSINFSKKIKVDGCKAVLFKWKKGSILNTYQNYDFSDVGEPEDVVRQGKYQLELDEDAFSVLDNSLPGRQRIVIRDPYYNGLPADLGDRRFHGVTDLPPETGDDKDEGYVSSYSYGQQPAKNNTLFDLQHVKENKINYVENVECCEDVHDSNNSQNIYPRDTSTLRMNGYSSNNFCNTVDQYIQQTNQFDEYTGPQDLLPQEYQVPTSAGNKHNNGQLTLLQKACSKCKNKQNASTGMTKKDDYETEDKTEWHKPQDLMSDMCSNQQQQVPCCAGQQPEILDFQQMYNADNFHYERGCYDIEQINMDDFMPKKKTYDYSLNRSPLDEFDCCGGFHVLPSPPQSDVDYGSSCCSSSIRSDY